jgi:hypothetical protein
MPINLPNRRTGRALLTISAVLACACDRFAIERQRSQSVGYAETDSMGVAVRDIATIELRGNPKLAENSAVTMSRARPGVLFSLEDSGNDPQLFGMDTTGAKFGAWRVKNATNVDWESLSAGGACGDVAANACLYIGDTGDNNARRAFRVIYRTPEPNASTRSLTAAALEYVYSDGPHDVEAMFVAPNGDVVLITKRPLVDRSAILRPALVFVLPSKAWQERGRVTAALVDSLPIVPGSAPLRSITDAALSPDAKHVAVRTYAQTYIFRTDSVTGRVDHRVAPAVCNIVPLNEAQGEGVTWIDNEGRLAFTSEGKRAPLHLGTCPLP